MVRISKLDDVVSPAKSQLSQISDISRSNISSVEDGELNSSIENIETGKDLKNGRNTVKRQRQKKEAENGSKV
jgi:hypothetical protein